MARKTPHEVNIDFIELGINIEKRIISIDGEIEEESIGRYRRAIQLMVMANRELPILIDINSAGGDCYTALGFYGFLKALPVKLKTRNVGLCASAGTLIYLAGDDRDMADESVFMFHTISDTLEGKFKETLKDGAIEGGKILSQLTRIYGSETNKDQTWWSKKIEYRDIYVRKDEAFELSIIKKIDIQDDWV